MKTLLLIAISLLSLNCARQSAATVVESDLAKPPPIANRSIGNDTNKYAPVEDAKSGIEESERQKIIARNAEFETVPEEWKKIDFHNFNYTDEFFPRGIVIKDGKFEFDFKEGRGLVSFDKVFYFDVTGDKKTDAIVILLEYHCGAGCSASKSYHFYFFSLEKTKPKFIWDYNTNMVGYDGGLKSLIASNKQITIEEFGKCTKSEQLKNPFCNSAYNSKNIDRKTFTFDGKTFVVSTKEFVETDYINVFNYQPEIGINEFTND